MILRPCLADIVTNESESYYAVVMGVAKRARMISNEWLETGEVEEIKPVQLAVEDFSNRKCKIVEPTKE